MLLLFRVVEVLPFFHYIFLGIVQMYRYHNILKAYAGSLAEGRKHIILTGS